MTFSDGTRSIPKTVTSQGSGTTVNATLAVSDFGLGAAQLRDGPITVTAVATDLAGNVGAANTSQFVRNSSTPALSNQERARCLCQQHRERRGRVCLYRSTG